MGFSATNAWLLHFQVGNDQAGSNMNGHENLDELFNMSNLDEFREA